MKKIAIFVVMISMSALTGCAFHAQKAHINPVLDVPADNVGHGESIGFKVEDERASTSLGHRGSAYGAAAEITSDQDLAAVLHDKIAAGLKQKGFNVVDYSAEKSRQLTVELHDIKYSTSTGFWTGGVDVSGALKSVANNGGKTYEHFYRTDNKERVVVVPGASKNEAMLNSAVSDLLKKLFDDSGLFMFLTTDPKSIP